MLVNVEEWLTDAAKGLAEAVAAIKAGEFGHLKEATLCMRDLKNAAFAAYDERNRVEKLRKQGAGSVGAGDLDLDAARDEIGRRLARLRDAGDA